MSRRKPKRQEIKAQRRAAMLRKRAETGWEPRTEPAVDGPLARLPVGLDAMAGGLTADQQMDTLLGGRHWADQPELAHVCANVGETLSALSLVGSRRDAGRLELSAEEQIDEFRVDVLLELGSELLTERLRKEILDGLALFQERLRLSGDQAEMARVAFVHALLSSRQYEELWPHSGLVRSIVQRSMAAALQVADSMGETLLDRPRESFWEPELLQDVAQRVEEYLGTMPELKNDLSTEMDRHWDRGMDAIRSGTLCLEIFTEEEVIEAARLMATFWGSNTAAEKEAHLQQLTEEELRAMFSRLEQFLSDLLTPARLDQLRATVQAGSQDPELPREYRPFMLLLDHYLREGTLEQNRGFLIQALFAEVRYLQWIRDPDEPLGDSGRIFDEV